MYARFVVFDRCRRFVIVTVRFMYKRNFTLVSDVSIDFQNKDKSYESQWLDLDVM